MKCATAIDLLLANSLFVCLYQRRLSKSRRAPSPVSAREQGATSRKLGQSPYQSATMMESATGILQGFSLRICMNLSGVNLKLHTSHSNLQSMCRPEHWEISWQYESRTRTVPYEISASHCFDLVLLGAGNFWTKMLKSKICITGSPKSKFWIPKPYGG